MLIYAKSVNDYGLDMQANIREVVPYEKFRQTDYLNEVRKIFSAGKNL